MAKHYVSNPLDAYMNGDKKKPTGAGEVRTDYGERPTAGEGVVDPTKEPGWEPAQEIEPWSKPDETTGISTQTDPVTGTESIYQGEPQLPVEEENDTLLTGGSTKLTRGPTTWSGEGGTGREGGRKRKDGRLEMSTGSKRASILAPA